MQGQDIHGHQGQTADWDSLNLQHCLVSSPSHSHLWPGGVLKTNRRHEHGVLASAPPFHKRLLTEDTVGLGCARAIPVTDLTSLTGIEFSEPDSDGRYTRMLEGGWGDGHWGDMCYGECYEASKADDSQTCTPGANNTLHVNKKKKKKQEN